MATFTKPAVDSPFSKLPAELATRILEYVFAGRSRDVAQCRLVCQDLYTLSSPYLIRTVVVAERLPALRKLREVILHPYFSKHVTHLIWDASYYESGIATDFHLYEDAFERSEHLASSRDEAYIKARQSDALLLKTVESYIPRNPRIPISLRGSGHLLEYGTEPPTDDEQGFPLNSRWRDRSQPEDILSMPDIRSSRFYRDSADFQDGNHMAGCHIGFADYYRCWENQNKIRGQAWETDGNRARYLFFEAFRRLPQLRNIAHTDYRALAYNGESLAHLCQRLFGHTVCPTWSNIDSVSEDLEADEDRSQGYHRRFQTFLEDISRAGRAWDSISIGRHPFEVNYHDYNYLGSRTLGRKNVELRYDALFSKSGPERQMNVRSLRLPILTGGEDSISKFGGLSNLVTDSLLELEVGEVVFYRLWDRFKKSPPHLQRFGPGESFGRLFHSAADPSTLRSLRSLTLRGSLFPTDGLRVLLLDQMPALRTLRLIDCLCKDGYRQFSEAIQTTIQPATKFNGVEIFGLRFKQLEGETEDHEHAQEYREKLQVRRAHEYERHQDGRESYLEGLLLSDWPYERPELEAALLGGRTNMISRNMYAAPNDEARWNWQDVLSPQI